MVKPMSLRVLLGVTLLAGLLFLVVLPVIPGVELRDPHVAQTAFLLDGTVRLPPLPPGEAGFVLGTDRIGRDVLSRVVYGARMTLLVAAVITGCRCLIAVPLGLWCGWNRGWAATFSRVVGNAVGAVPVVVAAAITLGGLRYAIREPQAWLFTYCFVMVTLGVPRLMEQIRRRTEEVAAEPYIESAIAVGAPPVRIIRRHIMPHLTADILVAAAFDLAWTLMVLGQLAVLGIYVGGSIIWPNFSRPPSLLEYQPEWGQMLGTNLDMVRTYPWMSIIPGLALGLAAVGCHLVASGVERHRRQ